MDDSTNQEIPCPVKQLWTMTPIGAAWTEGMQLGGQLHGQAIDEFYQDLYDTNLRLNAELGAAKLRLQFAREFRDEKFLHHHQARNQHLNRR